MADSNSNSTVQASPLLVSLAIHGLRPMEDVFGHDDDANDDNETSYRRRRQSSVAVSDRASQRQHEPSARRVPNWLVDLQQYTQESSVTMAHIVAGGGGPSPRRRRHHHHPLQTTTTAIFRGRRSGLYRRR